MKDALNEHQKLLRRRGRPKILHAKSYSNALETFNKYKSNILGIISDVRFKKNRKDKGKERYGIEFCQLVKNEDKFMNVLLQSSDASMAAVAGEMKIGFLYKYSKNLSYELNEFIVNHFAFGDFVFRDPDTMEEVARAEDLQALQHQLLNISDRVLAFHTSRNDFSKWFHFVYNLFSSFHVLHNFCFFTI